MEKNAYLLVFGLSANPAHQGHVQLVSEAASALRTHGSPISRVLITPVYRRNATGKQKDDLPETFEDRFAMCLLAATEIADRLSPLQIPVEVSRIEETLAKLRSEPNWTMETLTELHAHWPAHQLMFLLSSDIVSGTEPELARWSRIDELLRLTTLVICPRPGHLWNVDYLLQLKRQDAHLILLAELALPDISSTAIRTRIASGEDPLNLSEERLIPLSIARYIKQRNLYGSTSFT